MAKAFGYDNSFCLLDIEKRFALQTAIAIANSHSHP
jgi:hypothetical protein